LCGSPHGTSCALHRIPTPLAKPGSYSSPHPKGQIIRQNRGLMNTSSPFSFLESIATRFQPPSWVVDEAQQRLILFLNHVVMQEKEAKDRLARKKGSVLHVRWGLFAIDILITPAGLLDRALPTAKPDLLISVAADSPAVVLQSLLAGKPPPVKIEGDVQLAAELGWLAENLRWDVEEDLSRVLGDIPAHALADAGRRLLAALKSFLVKNPLASAANSSTASSQKPGSVSTEQAAA
jgi:ubiquinone biosynthesis protein UbiJ